VPEREENIVVQKIVKADKKCKKCKPTNTHAFFNLGLLRVKLRKMVMPFKNHIKSLNR